MSSYVCEDLMANIFERLPYKSVVRLRILSKYWFSRLASPDFVRMHTLRSLKKKTSHQKVLLRHSFKKDANIFTLHSQGKLPLNPKRGYTGITGVEIPYDISGAEIVGSCNGILCLRKHNGLINLWNFSVRRKLVVPAHPSIGASKEVPDVVFGFGYDGVTHDYNVVGISFSNDEGVAQNVSSFIYSMKTNSWSMIAPPTSLFFDVMSNACFLNGNLYWVVFGATESEFIMTFSLTTRVFGTIQLPKYGRHGHQLTIIDGSLAVIASALCYTHIWVMRKYGNAKSWLKFSEMLKEDDDYMHVFQPITNGDLLLYAQGERSIFNDVDCINTKILEFKPDCCGVGMETYVETLELLDKGIPCGTTIFPLTKTHKRKRSFTSLDDDEDDDDDDDDDNDNDDDDDVIYDDGPVYDDEDEYEDEDDDEEDEEDVARQILADAYILFNYVYSNSD